MARSRTTNEVVASAADSSPKSLAQPATVTGSDIAGRATATLLVAASPDTMRTTGCRQNENCETQ